jgi:hypothetical protein
MRFPLIDQQLSAADFALGLDWPGLFAWMLEHPTIARVLEFSYGSGLWQMICLLMFLPALGRPERLRELFWLFVITSLIVALISGIMPAAGAWAHYRVSQQTSAYYLPDFYALRDGSLREIAITKITGIVQFPSFHASTALVYIYVTRGMRYVFPVSCLWNAAMIASAPVYGGHHFVDILAGLALTPIAILMLRLWRIERSEMKAWSMSEAFRP